MIITQRSYSQTATFQFEKDSLAYTKADSFGSYSITLPYGSIGMDQRTVTERNGSLFSGGILLLLWGGAQCVYSLLHGGLEALLFLFPGLMAFALHRSIKTTVTFLNSDAGDIAIFHGSSFETVMNEIQQRRKVQLLDWYGNINFANDPEDEIRKFTWLHTQNLIEASQLQQIIATIRSSAKQDPDELEKNLLPRQ